MKNQNFCEINKSNNICENIVVWDGDPQTWTPPESSLLLIQNTTPSKTWGWDEDLSEWVLVQQIGGGQIGYSWDGQALITDQPKPIDPPPNSAVQQIPVTET